MADQKRALDTLVSITEPATVDPLVHNAALAIINACDAKDDECEVRAVYDAVKHGTPYVEGLEDGFKYVSDPRWADFFSSPSRILKQLAAGYNGGDCDEHAALLCGLLGSIGFICGFRAWGPTKKEFTHVYAVVGMPKNDPEEWLPLDTTVDDDLGWEPPRGHTLDAIMDGT